MSCVIRAGGIVLTIVVLSAFAARARGQNVAGPTTTTRPATEEVAPEHEWVPSASGPVRSPQFPRTITTPTPPSLDPLIAPDPLGFVFRPWNQFKAQLDRDLGLKIEGSYTFHNQYATETTTPRDDELGGRLDFGVNWTMLQHGKDTGQLIVLLRSSENIGMTQDYAVSDAAGSIMGTNSLHGGGKQIPISLNLLYWRQSFADGKFAVNVGKFHPNTFIDLSAVANDETQQFMSGAYTGNLSNPNHGAWAPGVAFEFIPDPRWYVNALVINNQGKTQTSGLNDIRANRLYEAAEIGYKTGGPQRTDPPQGNYRLTVWHNERDSGSGFGFSVGFDQEIGWGWTPFGRYGHGDGDATNFTDFATFGITNLHPFNRHGDMFGIAGSWSRPSDRTLREEMIFETFYRIKLTDSIELSPDIQWLVHPAFQPDVDHVWLFGVRLRVLF